MRFFCNILSKFKALCTAYWNFLVSTKFDFGISNRSGGLGVKRMLGDLMIAGSRPIVAQEINSSCYYFPRHHY